jgi:2-keto-4-pentenoate hydratase
MDGHDGPLPGRSSADRCFDGIADNGSGAAAVLGPAVEDWRGLPFETMNSCYSSRTPVPSTATERPAFTDREALL